MNDARRAIPGQAPVPFHIAIEREQLALGIEIEIVGIAKTGKHQLPFFTLGIGSQDVTAGSKDSHGVAARIPLAWQQQFFVKILVRRARQ